MCLGTKLSDRSLACYKAKGKKRGYIRVWKVVDNQTKRFRPELSWTRLRGLYKDGLNLAWGKARDEQRLIHAFRSKATAKSWGVTNYQALIEVLVHPDWIMAISLEALTTKAIVMPAYPKRKVTVREFRAAIKGKKVKTYSWEKA